VIFKPQSNKARYMQIGSRIGLALAVLAELIVGVYFGLIAAILVALAVPFVGEALDCMMLFVAIVLAVIGFYLGMLGGLIAWSFRK
jgi:steroid 5-alpha reductase family enzyme